MYIDGVFSGGGVKGIALAGAYEVLEEKGFRFQRVAGTSVGAPLLLLSLRQVTPVRKSTL
nr:patatin-like phospholipase family protein [Bacillus subtilis]